MHLLRVSVGEVRSPFPSLTAGPWLRAEYTEGSLRILMPRSDAGPRYLSSWDELAPASSPSHRRRKAASVYFATAASSVSNRSFCSQVPTVTRTHSGIA